jgi:hypothetical protein
MQQALPNLFLQPPDLPAERRLRDAERGGRLGEAPCLRDLQEGLKALGS